MNKLSIFFILFAGLVLQAQKIDRIEPPYWWANMNNPQLQLMVYGEQIAQYKPSISTKSVRMESVIRVENENYLFINLDLSNASPGKISIDFLKKGKRNNISYTYEIKKRTTNSSAREGFDSSDVIYLITPDRFANGDSSNDVVKGLRETTIDRKDDYARHGGDLKGITDHVDYIADMGFTAIWPCPVLTNDMERTSYHGYAMTDFYQVDPRFGSIEDYINLSEKADRKGVKLIMDQVANHCGLEHWWMKDLPMSDWVNYQEVFENKEEVNYSNHRRTINQDLYGSKKDAEGMSYGWFSSKMPDLNQRNPFMATYLIQNSIWWVETLNLGGIRQDTYPYPDKEFMAKWAGAIMKEYPDFSIVGEEWSYNPLLVGYWQQGQNNKDGYESNLTSTMDFPMQRTIVKALNDEESWGTGLVTIYEGLANDFHYANPADIVIFPDNHDMDRIYTQVNEDPVLTKMALSYMLSLPRIAQVYYGTEILMENTKKPGDHGLIRTDFPGGWKGDKTNGFSGKGLTKSQKDMQLFMKTLLNYRKNSEAIHKGKTLHFAPERGVYVLFRMANEEVVVVILNKNEEPVSLNLDRFSEVGLGGKKLKNVISGTEMTWNNSFKINQKGAILLTTKMNE